MASEKAILPSLPQVKIYDRLSESVERGLAFGIRHFLKYEPDEMSEDAIGRLESNLSREIMNALCEDFEV